MKTKYILKKNLNSPLQAPAKVLVPAPNLASFSQTNLVKSFFIILVFISIFSLVGADIFSINSGGSTNLIINPGAYLEGFFFSANVLPVLSNLILFSSSGTNTTNENLSVSYDAIDDDGDSITNISDWRVDGNSLAVLNMPFDTRRIKGNVRDYSTYENNGTLGAGNLTKIPIWSSDCQVGGCYEFDGGDYIDIPYRNFNLNGFSISFWINTTSKSKTVFNTYWNTPRVAFVVTSSGTIYFNIRGWNGTSVPNLIATSLSVVSDGEYHLVTGVKDNDNLLIYVDGINERNLTGAENLNPTSARLTLGLGAYGGYRVPYVPTYIGNIDEFQVYSHALSSEQIQANYQAGLAGHQVENLVSQETTKGEIWQVAMTPNDVFGDGATVLSNELEIINDAPEDPANVNLVSLDGTNESDVDLNCSAYIEDPDNLLLNVSVNWFKENISQYNFSFSNQDNDSIFLTNLLNENLTLGDIWKCSVRADDGADYSAWVDSNELEIIDITNPLVYIESPNETNYTTLEVDFNVSVIENENISICQYSLDWESNVTMNEVNDSYFWYEPILGPGPHEVVFYCNDTSGNWGSNSTTFEILNEAAISIDLSDALSWNVNWSLVTLPANDLDAEGNNLNDSTSYYINVSAENTNVDLYVRADGDLLTESLDVIGLGNETYKFSINDSTVSNDSMITMSTNYSLIGGNLGDLSVVYLKFYLDAPVGQAAGMYLNSLEFKAVRYGQDI